MQVKVVTFLLSLAWVSLLLRWRVSIFGGRIEILSSLMLMKFVASYRSCSWAWIFVRWIDAGRVIDLIVWLSVGSFCLQDDVCPYFWRQKLKIVLFFLSSDEICSLLPKLFMGLKNFEFSFLRWQPWKPFLAAEEIRWINFQKKNCPLWIDAG